MLAASVHARERLLVKQADQTVPQGNLLHDFHGQLVVVGCDIGGAVDRRQLVLRGRDFVVLGFRQNAEFPEFFVQIRHVSRHAGFDDAEVMVVQFLSLGRLCAEQGAPREHQILALLVHFLINKEVFLFRSDRSAHALDLGIAEQPQDAHSLTVQRLHRAEQGRLFVECLAAVGAERGRNAKGFILDESIGGRIPCGVAARFKGCAQTAGGEGGRVRFALDQFLAGELHDDAAVRRRRDEAVVLFRSDSRQGLKPVREVRGAVRNRPVLHGFRNCVRHIGIQACALVDGLFQRTVDVGGKGGFHHSVVEYQTAEVIRNRVHCFTLLVKNEKALKIGNLQDAFAFM